MSSLKEGMRVNNQAGFGASEGDLASRLVVAEHKGQLIFAGICRQARLAT
jgi:hypothetical protein